MKLKLYCNSYAGKDPLHVQTQRTVIQETLMCGSYHLDAIIKQQCIDKGYILDDVNKNISHLNTYFGDLTGLYWIWKNTNDEFVGTNQYRRFYDDQQLNELTFDKNTLYISQFLHFGISVWNQFISSHGTVGMDLLKKAIQLKSVKMEEHMFDQLWSTNRLSSCNTFFAHRTIFDKLCEILFEMMFELYRGSKYLLDSVQKDSIHAGRVITDKRLLAFLAERVLNIIYNNIHYYLGNVNLITLKYNTMAIISHG